MITISEARTRTSESTVAIDLLIGKIGAAIEKACDNNEREIILDECLPYGPIFTTVHNSYSHPNLGSPKVIAIQKELSKYGFTITSEQRKHNVGGGLGSMGEESREETWGHYIIKW